MAYCEFEKGVLGHIDLLMMLDIDLSVGENIDHVTNMHCEKLGQTGNICEVFLKYVNFMLQ